MSRKRGGFGLGLSITRQILQRMGGEIGVTSELHKGSEFWFELSLPTASVSSVRRQELVGGLEEIVSLPDARVLVVEDDELCRTVAVEMLKAHHCVVDAAQNGADALDLLDQNDYDLVFMDCQMPIMDGYQATRIQRRREERGAHIPIVAMTAHALARDRTRCLDAGMDAYLTKPIDRDKVDMTLRRFFGEEDPTGRKKPVIAGGLARLDETEMEILDPSTFGTAIKLIGLKKAREILTQGTEQLIDQIQEAHSAGDLETLAATAHKLIGRTRTLGALKMGDICRTIVNAGLAGAVEGLEFEIGLLQEAFQEVLRALDRHSDSAS